MIGDRNTGSSAAARHVAKSQPDSRCGSTEASAFFAAGFFTAGFLTAVFLAAGFLAGAFLAAGSVTLLADLLVHVVAHIEVGVDVLNVIAVFQRLDESKHLGGAFDIEGNAHTWQE